MNAFKGFNRDLTCRGYQFEIGKTYEEQRASLCESGFHACEHPLDVFDYYPPATSRYAEVVLDGVSDERQDTDTKVCAQKITIKAELDLPGIIKAAVEYTFAHAKKTGKKAATGYRGAASATGYRGAASATGIQGAASATGYQGAASATGYRGAASATGIQGAASATGYQGAASATGIQGAASATGYRGAASATGYQGAASATGIQGAASATGIQGAASATGIQGAASATGDQSIACAHGICSSARGALGNWIVLSEWRGESGEWQRINVKAFKVDGKRIKPEVFYTLKKGKAVQA